MTGTSLRRLYLPGGIVAALLALNLLAPLLPLHDVATMQIPDRFAPPSWHHPLGLDEYGRDVLSRIVHGTRTSLTIALSAALISAVAGTLLGLLGGYFRGLIEVTAVRSTEIILYLPPLLLALLVVTLLGAGSGTLILALSILFIPAYARVAFAATLQLRSLEFVVAQESLGTRPALILSRTILPNAMPPLLVQLSLTAASALVLESGLSFLGLGVVPPEPSLGLMIRAARSTIDFAPLLLVWPSLALAGIILALNFLCDRLRDVLDARGSSHGGARWLRRSAQRPAVAGDGGQLGGFCDGRTLLELRGLSVTLAPDGRTGDAVELVRDVNLQLTSSETLVIVGESGSGKTLTGLAIMGLLPDGLRVSAGKILFSGCRGVEQDLARMTEKGLRELRGDRIGMMFQDPGSSLNPVLRIGDQIAEAVAAHRRLRAGAVSAEVADILRRVGMPDPERRARAWPHELSGGQRQRAMIAIALVNRPQLLIADEPTTALDPTIQAQILRGLATLKGRDDGMAMLFITHDLAVASAIADRVCVMYAGEIVEEGPAGDIFARPRHPYTAALLASSPHRASGRPASIAGSVPRAHEMPAGCRFAGRCAHVRTACKATPPLLERVEELRGTRCIRWREVT